MRPSGTWGAWLRGTRRREVVAGVGSGAASVLTVATLPARWEHGRGKGRVHRRDLQGHVIVCKNLAKGEPVRLPFGV